ncbi:MAG: DUF116 domain-containing protein [Peptostreptococcaceae bacterium]|jgi:hypothetical protein|nr:DUF116 domain-containing protein [Peptostreptococcaceae bacterium]
MDKDLKYLNKIFIFLVMFFLISFLLILNSSLRYFIVNIFNLIIFMIIVKILLLAIVTNLILKNKIMNINIMKMNFLFFKIFYPVIESLIIILKKDKHVIRRILINLNNKIIYNMDWKLKGEDILIMLPHCLQLDDCSLKITSNIDNCKECGRCDLKEILRMKSKYNVLVHVATGGTLARKKIKEIRPKAIIAVACERDLSEGIKDISKIPVFGVLNKRPNGPCFNTKIDINELENSIKFLINDR